MLSLDSLTPSCTMVAVRDFGFSVKGKVFVTEIINSVVLGLSVMGFLQ